MTTLSGQPRERDRVDVSDDDECRYWCSEFGCQPAQLKAAVSEVGDRPQDVKQRLQHLMNVRVDTTG